MIWIPGAHSKCGAPSTTFSKACGKKLEYKMADRRPGDVAVCYGAPDKAKAELGWVAELGLEAMCADSWRWISNNPDGFGPDDGSTAV